MASSAAARAVDRVPRRPRADKDSFLKQARERFEQGQEAIHNQREREMSDLAFYAGGDRQWDPDALKARRAQNADNQSGLPPVPARPVITVNKTREPIAQILNTERQSDMSIELAPADDFAALVGPIDPTEIEVREGLVRRIQRASEAADARTWAFKRAVIAGVGYYRVNIRYVKGKTRDQEVVVERIWNQAAVTLDPAHEQPDGSDAEWWFIGADVPLDRFKSDHPKYARLADQWAGMGEEAFRAIGEEYPGWFAMDGKRRSVHVVEYGYLERTPRTVLFLADGTDVWADEFEGDDADVVDERDEVEKTWKWAKIVATEILDETDLLGPDCEIIKVLGEELLPFDQERRAEGMIRQARGGQEGFNVFISKFVEVVGLTPLAEVAIDPKQIEGYEKWWQAKNTRTLPYLPFSRMDVATGQELGDPIMVNRQAPVQELAMGLQIFDEAIKATTQVPSVQLGQNTDARLKSGRAIQMLQQQAELGTSNYLDNMKRSIRYEGQVINNRLYPVYGTRPGRLVRIMTGENDSQTVQIGAMNGQGSTAAGRAFGGNGNVGPSALAGPMGSQSGGGSPQGATPNPKIYQLTKDANFNAVVKVTRAFESRRMEESKTIADLIQSNPAFIGWFGDLFFANQDGPGHEEMAERAKVMLDPKIQQYLSQKQQGQNVPPQLMAQIAQMQERLQKAEQIMQAMGQEIKTKQAEQETKWKIANLEKDKAVLLQAMKDATTIEAARISAGQEAIAAEKEDQEEAVALHMEQAHESVQNELDRQHERDMAQSAQAHAAAMGAAGASTASSQSAQEHQQGMEAAAQPPPVNPNEPAEGSE